MNDDFVNGLENSIQRAANKIASPQLLAMIEKLRIRNAHIQHFTNIQRSNAIDATAALEMVRALPRGSHVLAVSIQAHLLGVEVAASWRPIQSELFCINYFFQMERAS
jgi:hypothetical protein